MISQKSREQPRTRNLSDMHLVSDIITSPCALHAGYLALLGACFVIKGKQFRNPSALSEHVSKQEKQNRNNTCPFGLMAEYGIVLLNTRHGTRRDQSQTEPQNSVKCWLRDSPACFRLLQCSFEDHCTDGEGQSVSPASATLYTRTFVQMPKILHNARSLAIPLLRFRKKTLQSPKCCSGPAATLPGSSELSTVKPLCAWGFSALDALPPEEAKLHNFLG